MNDFVLFDPISHHLRTSDPTAPKYIAERSAVIRQYRAGDERQILPLFNKVLGNGSPKTLEHFDWQFWEHPQGRGWLTVAEVNEEIVGLVAVMRQHLNYSGREIIAGQGVDLVVHPEHRRKSLFIEMRESSRKHVHSEGAELISGFPNRMAYLTLINYPNWFKVTHLKSFTYEFGWKRIGAARGSATCNILGAIDSLKNKIRVSWKRKPKNVTIVDSSSLPDDSAETLLEINSFEVLSVWKDLEYLKWRYENHPKHRYRFHRLIISNKVEGLIVSRNCGDWIALCEVMNRTKDIEQTALLLEHVVDYYRQTPATEIAFWGFDTGFFETAFREAGFTMKNTSGIVFGIRISPDSHLEKIALMPHNWTISYGDTDHI